MAADRDSVFADGAAAGSSAGSCVGFRSAARAPVGRLARPSDC